MCSAAPSSPHPRPAPPLAHPLLLPPQRRAGRAAAALPAAHLYGAKGGAVPASGGTRGPFRRRVAAAGGGAAAGAGPGQERAAAGPRSARDRPPVRGAAAMLRGDEFLSSPPRKAVRFGGTLPDILLKYGQVSLRERPCGGAATPALSAERVAQTARQLQLQLPLVLLPPPSVGFPSCSPSLCRCLAALGRLGTLAARVGFVRRVVNILYFSSPC